MSKSLEGQENIALDKTSSWSNRLDQHADALHSFFIGNDCPSGMLAYILDQTESDHGLDPYYGPKSEWKAVVDRLTEICDYPSGSYEVSSFRQILGEWIRGKYEQEGWEDVKTKAESGEEARQRKIRSLRERLDRARDQAQAMVDDRNEVRALRDESFRKKLESMRPK